MRTIIINDKKLACRLKVTMPYFAVFDLPIVAEFGIRSPVYMADEGTTLTVPIDLVNGELDGVSLTVEVSCSSNTATSK